MGKAIYVMDTPKECDECPLSLETELVNTIICRGCEKYSINSRCTGKPDWCPLREMPEKKVDIGSYPESYVRGCVDGFNDCLDAIISGGTGNA